MIKRRLGSALSLLFQTSLLSVLTITLSTAGCTIVQPQRAPHQWAYTLQPASDWGVSEDENKMDITIPAFDPLTAAGPSDQIKAQFRGTDRKGPKTSITDGQIEAFENIPALIASLQSDDEMRNHTPSIQRDSNSRFNEEQRNVRVPAWIYAIKYEADQDWHVIIGTDPSSSSKAFFNAEVSGLPPQSATAYDTLLEVRNQLAMILDNDLPQSGTYRKYSDPIPVIVEGSVFYDIDHAPGVVGPTETRPKTAWEIHPITKLELVQ